MAEFIFMILFGALLTGLGISNAKGNLSSIHWYNRRRVTKENQRAYGRCMGLGTGLIGVSLVITGALQLVQEKESHFYLLSAGVLVGLAFMLYAQIKYNKGIF